MLEVKPTRSDTLIIFISCTRFSKCALSCREKKERRRGGRGETNQENSVNPSKLYRYHNKTVGDRPEFARSLDCYGFSYSKLYVMTMRSLNFSVPGRRSTDSILEASIRPTGLYRNAGKYIELVAGSRNQAYF